MSSKENIRNTASSQSSAEKLNGASNSFFISGTDTGVGKTICSLAVALFLESLGKTVAYIKPVETGCVNDLSSDKQLLSEFIKDSYCFYKLSKPISPHLASKADGIEISIEQIKKQIAELSTRYDYLVIEGAGGLLVPITGNYDFSNLVAELDLNLILVTSSKLGVLNQAKLNFEYIRAKKLKVLGYVFNENILDSKDKSLETNRKALADISRKYDIPELFSLPFFESRPAKEILLGIMDKSLFSAKIRP